MKKINTSKLSGKALDWTVAKCVGLPIKYDPMSFKTHQKPGGYWTMEPDIGQAIVGCSKHIGTDYSPSTNWMQGGQIIEREKIWLRGPHDACKPDGTAVLRIDYWYAHINHHHVQNDPSPLVAAMRCFVASQLGDEVEIPEELMETA